MEQVEQINWVGQRAECLLPDVFRQLRDVVRRDMGEALVKSPLRSDFTFTFSAVRDHEFVVVRKSKPNTLPTKDYLVTFTLNPDSICVHVIPPHPDFKNGFFHVLSTWRQSEGRCRLMIDETPYELWQISQLALERLVFQHPAE